MENSELYVIGVPMYNFTIPSHFKSFLDNIVRSGKTFSASESGYEGLLKNKKAVIVCSSGGEYASEHTKDMDFARPYLKMIFGFIGVTDVTFVNIQPTLFYGETAKQEAMEAAVQKIDAIITELK